MKKILVLSILFSICISASAFAAPLEGVGGGLVSLSKGVSGNYFPNTNPATDFVMSTGHTQGNQVYATGSFTTAIWKKSLTAAFDSSSDLLAAPSGTSVDEGAFSGFGEI